MPRQPTIHAYRLSRLHAVFLVSNLLLLASILWMVVGDYTREWKDVQRGFQDLERSSTAAALDAELASRDQAALEQAQADLAAAEAALAEQQEAYEVAAAELAVLEGAAYARDLDLKNAKANVAVYKYNYELAQDGHHDHDVTETERLYTDIAREIARMELAYEGFQQELDAASAKVESYTGAGDEARKRIERLRDTETRLLTGLRRFDDTYLPNKVRDAVLIDFLDPRVKIQQILLPEFVDDLNMDTTMKIDRCTTCHQGINTAAYADAPQPYTAHPQKALFVGSDSPHPIETFGCTVCHSGRGRGTTFLRATHWPNSPADEARWRDEHHWHEMHHWDFDQVPTRFLEANCYQCHQGQTEIDGAPKWNRGIQLMKLHGCFGCHKVKGYEDVRNAGPTLRHLANKTTPDWAYQWIRDPRGYRPATRMPQLFDLDNISDEENRRLTTAGINAMVAYLFAESEGHPPADLPVAGNATRGKALVQSVGCMGCHQLGAPTTLDRLHPRNRGPNLANLGSKLNAPWLFSWLKDPRAHFPDTWMPNLRLSDQEAADITAHLLRQRDAEFEARVRAEAPPAARETLMLEFLQRSLTEKAAREKVAGMSIAEQEHFLGRRLIARNGCFGCHDIAGFENEQRIGTDLTEEGSKDVLRFDFGLIPSHPDGGHEKHAYTMDHSAPASDAADAHFYVPRTRHDWLMTKLLHPRIWDRGRVKSYDEYLKMPFFDFSVQDAEEITTAVLGFQRSLVPGGRKYRMSPERLGISEGRRMVQDFNCRACHVIEGEGRAIAETIDEPAFLPPILTGQGQKTQTQWLFDFLVKPVPIRPWLKVRMPTFGFRGPQSNTFVEYFARLDDEEFPSVYYDPDSISKESLAIGEQMFTMFQCQQCHVLGTIPKGVDPISLAPNLRMARTRLKPGWVTNWILDPDVYQPGTKMPAFFPDGAEEESPYDAWFEADPVQQAGALRDHIFVGLHGGNGNYKPGGAAE